MLQQIAVIISAVFIIQNVYVDCIPRRAKKSDDITDPNTWKSIADREMHKLIEQSTINGRPRNLILFIGDGMSLSTVTATRYLKANVTNQLVGETTLVWDNWPVTTLIRTFNTDRMTTDSAAAATAILSGTKSIHLTIGIIGQEPCCICEMVPSEQRTRSSLLQAQDKGLATGIVTTTRVTHATPAAAYANTRSRYWEGNTGPPSFIHARSATNGCEDIASQLLTNGINFNVVLGGGLSMFHQNKTLGKTSRTDGRDLIQEWESRQNENNRSYTVVLNRDQFEQLKHIEVDYLLGLLSESHMDFDVERIDQPSLAEMTEAAIRILSRNPKGYFLLVEAGRIDHGHHVNRAKVALTDTLALEKAVNVALAATNPEETLIVLTADHGHSFGLTGYSKRNRNVLDIDDSQKDSHDHPYIISQYFNGPSGENASKHPNFVGSEIFESGFSQEALIPLNYATHSPEDVPLYATGPFSHLFRPAADNTYIAYASMFSLCIGPYETASHCKGILRANAAHPGAIANVFH